MRKMIIYVILAIELICIVSAGCTRTNKEMDNTSITLSLPAAMASSPEASPDALSRLSEKEYLPTKENVKLLGRTYPTGNSLWLALSGTGIEFTFTGAKAELTLLGDNIIGSATAECNYCRYGIYVNDKLVIDDLLKEKNKVITVFDSTQIETVTIRVIKLSESASSTLGIGKIKVLSEGTVTPAPNKVHRIEFIGDSITCGYGVDNPDRRGTFSTQTEDVTKTYAYKTAQALNADYSIVAFSGYGVLSGHTANGVINTRGLLPIYYDKMGFSYGAFDNQIRVDTITWNFSLFVPDIIVINLGTNDYSYCKKDVNKKIEFALAYVSFLKQIRERNPDAVILCTLGMMGDKLYPYVRAAVSTYRKDTGDTKVYSMRFAVEKASDGYGTKMHPSPITHEKAAKKLTSLLQTLMDW